MEIPLIDGAEDVPTKFEIFDDSCTNAFRDSFRAGYLLAQMEEGDWNLLSVFAREEKEMKRFIREYI